MRVLLILLLSGLILAGDRHVAAVEKEVPGLTLEQVKESAGRIDAALLKVIKEMPLAGGPVIEVPPVASDDVFLRRLMVDVAGRLPTVAEVREFAQDLNEAKRERWAEKVAISDEAANWRFRRMADALRVKDEVKGASMRPYIEWLRGEVAKDASYDGVIRRMLEAKGTMKEDPASGFLLSDGRELRVTAGETMRALLGTDIQCAACHDDPFSSVSQREFCAFAGAFNRVTEDDRGALKLAAEPTPCKLPAGYLYRDGSPGEVVPIARLFLPDLGPKMGAKGVEWPQEAVRNALSEWVTGEDNLRFQDVAALRVWEWMFGRMVRYFPVAERLFASESPEEMMNRLNDCAAVGPGIGSLAGIEPVQSGFLVVLREEWVRCGRRMGEFQRVLAHTEAYQREPVLDVQMERTAGRSFLPAPTLRRLPAEVIYGALVEWSGNNDEGALPEVLPMDHPLRLLGRGGRVWADSDAVPVSHALARYLMNGELTKAASELPRGFRDRGVEEWFQAILGRTPAPNELRLAKSYLELNPESGMSDVVWALINTSEFVFQR